MEKEDQEKWYVNREFETDNKVKENAANIQKKIAFVQTSLIHFLTSETFSEPNPSSNAQNHSRKKIEEDDDSLTVAMNSSCVSHKPSFPKGYLS